MHQNFTESILFYQAVYKMHPNLAEIPRHEVLQVSSRFHSNFESS